VSEQSEQFRVNLSTQLDADDATELKKLARANDRSIMAEIRVAIRAHLEAARQHSVKA
jgi:hypothetical protein